MAITFNLDEVFEMAEQIEKNASNFYREASQKAPDPVVKKILTDFSGMENGHVEIFKAMRENLSEADREQPTFDPQNEAVLYLQSMADEHGTEGKKNSMEQLSGKESIKEIFDTAIKAERNSIVFYTGLKQVVSATGKSKLDEIIAEEFEHLAILKQQLVNLGQS